MSDSPETPGLLAELKRRKVFRVAGVYAVVAFAVLQAVDLAIEPLRLPAWTMTLLWVLALAGFPIAVVLAWALEVTPEGVRRTEDGRPRTLDHGGRLPSAFFARRSIWFALGMLVVLMGAWFAVRSDSPGPAGTDANTVAVLPFRTAGAAPELAYLREGMVDLLATKLTGEGGPRAVDPRTLMSAWRRLTGDDDVSLTPDSSRLLARRLGAGRVVLGELVSTPGRIILSASLYDVESGRVEQPVSVEGPVDSLTALVDRLAAALLSVDAGESERLAALTSISLPALRAYLAGQALYRQTRYADAEREFARALELDSTFALAAIGQYQSSRWGVQARPDDAALAVAWAHRDRLSPRDRVFLAALTGPDYPEPSAYADQLAVLERAVERTPDRAEAWFELGDLLTHFGGLLDLDNGQERALAAFERAAELDPNFGAAIQHLADLASMRGDSAAFYRYSDRQLELGPGELYVQVATWFRAFVFGDSAALVRLRADSTPASSEIMQAMLIGSALWNVGYEFTDGVAARILDHAGTAAERRRAAATLHDYLLSRGRPAQALRLTAEIVDPESPYAHLRLRIEDALFAGGDSAAAADAARALAAAPGLGWRERCALEQWRVRHGETGSTRAAIAALRTAAAELEGEAAVSSGLCADLLETLLAAASRRSDALVRLERLDSLLATGPPAYPLREQANLTLAWLWAEQGHYEAALRAARRYSFVVGGELYFGTRVGMQARFAALAGKRDEAIGAYHHYLALHSDPEPSVRPEVERMRQDLARLVGER